MGAGPSSEALTKEEVDLYATLTFLKKNQIIRAFSLFRDLDPVSVDTTYMVRIPIDVFKENIPELKCNPFAERLMEMFSAEKDGCLGFEDFLDMLSVFSRAAPETLKALYAFRLYDFDGDSQLGRGDLGRVLERLTWTDSRALSRQQKLTIVDNILEESDIDRDGSISLQEFQHLVARCPDFVHAFSFEVM